MDEYKGFYRAFREYRDRLEADETHRAAVRALCADAGGEEAFCGRLSRCVWDEEWIDNMLDALPSVERALDEQRRFIESNAEIRRIDQARRTSVESVRHLAQHSNLISNVDGEDIIPDRVLIVERDDSYAIYENRFLYTLVLRMQAFLEERWRAVEGLNGAEAFSFEFERTASWNRRHIQAGLHLNYERRNERHRREGADVEMAPMEKLRRLRERVEMLTRAPLMRQLKGVTQVVPPIVRTNVFKKNHNFKRALELFEYLENYRKPGYEILTESVPEQRMPQQLRDDLCEVIALEGFVGRMAAADGLRQALEENYQRENEQAERERVRREAERERRVQERIAAARAEEIEIREAEVAKREAVIAGQNVQIASLEKALREAQARLRALEAQNAELNAQLDATRAELERTCDAREALRCRLEEALRRIEAQETQMQSAQARYEAEAESLREQMVRERREGAEALSEMQARMQEHLKAAERSLEAQKALAERQLQEERRRARDRAAQERRALEAEALRKRRELQEKLEKRSAEKLCEQKAQDDRRAAELKRALEAAQEELERMDDVDARRASRRTARVLRGGWFRRMK